MKKKVIKVYDESLKKWESESTIKVEEKTYSQVDLKGLECDKDTYKRLNISTKKGLNYIVRVNKDGKVILIYITDGLYNYSYNGEEELILDKVDLNKEIKEGSLEINCDTLKPKEEEKKEQ